MANKQLNQLNTVSGIAADDLIPVFDVSETGDEKLKNYTIQELKTDLTSMDPSAFGNWVKNFEYSGTTAGKATLASEDLRTPKETLIKYTIESVASSCDLYMQVGDSSNSWDSTDDSNYDGTHSWSQNRMLIETLTGSVDLVMIWNPTNKTLKVNGSYTNSSTANLDFTIRYKGSLDATRLYFFTYNSGNIDAVINLRVYEWQEIKPIELHSYELIKEYNLSSETMDDTFDWDGEADSECMIITDLTKPTTANARIYFNSDTGTNYDLSYMGPNGASMAQGFVDDVSGITLCHSAAGRSWTKTEFSFSNRGEYRPAFQQRTNHIPSDPDYSTQILGYRWKNTSDNVTSLKVTTDAAATGSIKIYRLAKTHLFNQTIYNNTTLNVATTGSDITGDGTSQKPFASINGALDWLKNKTINSDVTVTIQVADGTYNNQAQINFSHDSSNIIIVGNTTNPASVTLNFVSGNQGIYVSDGKCLTAKGIKMYGYSKAEGKSGFIAIGSILKLDDVQVENFGFGISSLYNALVQVADSNGVTTMNNCTHGLGVSRLSSLNWNTGTISNCDTYGINAYKGGRVHYGSVSFSGNGTDTSAQTGASITNG